MTFTPHTKRYAGIFYADPQAAAIPEIVSKLFTKSY